MKSNMRNLKLIHLTLALISSATAVFSPSASFAKSFASPTCETIFAKTSSRLSKTGPIQNELIRGTWTERRSLVEEFLRLHPEIPAYLQQTNSGLVPAVLLNEKTYSALKPLLEASVGYGFEQRPDHVDHGILRVGDSMIDFGHMNTRKGPPNTELHATGIAWKNLADVLPWRRTVIQMSYAMPKIERDDVRYYQLIRRASFFRTKFFFSEDQYLDRVTPDLFDNVVEDCFDFCKSDQIQPIISSINDELLKLTGKSAKDLFALPAVKTFVRNARRKVLNVGSFDPKELNRSMLHDVATASGLRDLLSAASSAQAQQSIMNLLASYESATAYERILRKYEISPDDGFADLHHAPVSFVVIMDHPDRADDFRSLRYSSDAKWFHWKAEGKALAP